MNQNSNQPNIKDDDAFEAKAVSSNNENLKDDKSDESRGTFVSGINYYEMISEDRDMLG